MWAWLIENWDWWSLVFLLGEFMFFLRILVQWASSEKAGKPVLPVVYWYISLIGALLVVLYAIERRLPELLLPQIPGTLIYLRNLQLEYRHRAQQARRETQGFHKPDFPWPSVSVVIGAHNEEGYIGRTVEALQRQDYRGPYEIIAALNGCTDDTRTVAGRYGIRIEETSRKGIALGRNLGGFAAESEILVFVDADTVLPEDGIRRMVEGLYGRKKAVACVGGRPDKGGIFTRLVFHIANWYTRRRQVSPPGPITGIAAELFRAVNGFDENLPQGLNTDLIKRCKAAGAEYVWIEGAFAETSTRRFEKTGLVRQMLAWRRNHRDLDAGNRQAVARRAYQDYR